MPINHQKSDSLEMDPELSPSCRLSDLSRGGSLESRSSSSRSRSLTSSVIHITQLMMWLLRPRELPD
uniref:Proline and serine rich 2 n=1 Tax=Molossus molossus TaxID=27622 RepID=A0A7J8K0B9_MOLMO|nr:proline and serine rich 2 [Molossus molossus]